MKKLILILISVVCLSSCSNKIHFEYGDYMIVTKSTCSATNDIHKYKISTKWKNGICQLRHTVIFAPANTYKVGDTLYFTTNKSWE